MAWQRSFVTMASFLEGSPESALLALSESEQAALAPLAAELTNDSRSVRAKAIASELAILARALEDLDLGAS